MADDPISILRELAARHKRNLSRIKLLDANVCSWTRVPDRPWESILTAGEPLTHQLRITAHKHKVRLLGNSAYLTLEVFGAFHADPFSINMPDKNGMASRQVETHAIGEGKYPAFTSTGTWSSHQDNFVSRSEFSELIRNVQLRDGEMVTVDGGSISLYLLHPKLERLTRLMKLAVVLAQQVEAVPQEQHFEKLPTQFHPIIPLIRKWAISDDSDRGEALTDSSKEILRALVDEVSPYLDSIDSYLNSFGSKAPPEEAVALGRLAECTVEARSKLSAEYS